MLGSHFTANGMLEAYDLAKTPIGVVFLAIYLAVFLTSLAKLKLTG